MSRDVSFADVLLSAATVLSLPAPEGGRRVARELTPVPRDANDKPWEHPADGGEPLDGHSWWSGSTRSFGLFQNSEEFPDDLAQAMRRVFERGCTGRGSGTHGARAITWNVVTCSCATVWR
jgi:hypothetical protein